MLVALEIPIHLVFAIALLFLAGRAFSGLRAEAAILREYLRPQSLRWLVLLYPLGVLLNWFGPYVTPALLAPVLGMLCFMPALVSARRTTYVLERAGTDRVDDALKATGTASLGAMLGLIYVALFFTLTLAAGSLTQITSR